jgi:hypothetical protein
MESVVLEAQNAVCVEGTDAPRSPLIATKLIQKRKPRRDVLAEYLFHEVKKHPHS